MPNTVSSSGFSKKSSESKIPASFDAYPHCHNKLVIISHRDENLDWINEIYCAKKVYGTQKKLASWEEPIEDIGNETYTYLYFLAHHYDEVETLNVFLPGDPLKHNPHIQRWINQLTPGSIDYLDLADASFYQYKEENEQPGWRHGVNDFFEAHLVGTLPEVFQYLPGNCFAVSRSRIHRYPRAFYFKLLYEFTRPEMKPIEILKLTHCLEKTWRYMFNTQYYPPKF
jgi:hypothetical protein